MAKKVYIDFNQEEIATLQKADYLIADDKKSASFAGNHNLWLKQIKKESIGFFEIYYEIKNPDRKTLTIVEQICNSHKWSFSTLTSAINYLEKTEERILDETSV